MSANTANTPVMVRPRAKGRIALDVPNPKKGRAYKWAADRAGHPQSYARYKMDGWRVVPASEAEELGLDGYRDLDTGLETVKDSANVIRFGDLILMDTTAENFYRLRDEKMGAYDAYEGTIEADAEEKIALAQEEYQRRKRGG